MALPGLRATFYVMLLRALQISVFVSGGMAWLPSGWAVETGQAPLAFFGTYCLDCHDAATTKGEVNIQHLLDQPMQEKPWEWLALREQISNGEMPPEDPLPDAAQRAAMLDWIDGGMKSVDWSQHRRAGTVPMARLTRDEYRNTLRDLLGIDLHAGDRLSPDGEGASGFRNDRDALGLNAAQLEAYFDESERLMKSVMALAGEPGRQRFSALEMAKMSAHKKMFEEGAMLVHPGDQIQAQVEFPVDGYYRFEVSARVFGKAAILDVSSEGEKVASAPVVSNRRQRVSAVGFVRGGSKAIILLSRNLVPQTPLPGDVNQRVVESANERGARLEPVAGGKETEERANARSALNERSAAIQEAYEWLRMIGPKGDAREIDRFRKYALERDAGSEAARDRLALAMNLSRSEFDAFWEQQNAEILADNRRVLESVVHVQWGDWQQYQGKIVADSLEVVGPLEDGGASLVRLTETDGALAREFVERAFRRPASDVEYARYERLRISAKDGGESSEQALRTALSAVLVSPEFLLRREAVMINEENSKPDAAAYPLDDFSLASRLSYFLWNSMPDGPLFELARDGRLRHPEVLREQAGRMLQDPRSGAFLASFTEQWLGLGELRRGGGVDGNLYPQFTDELAAAMWQEAIRLFGDVVLRNQSLLHLIAADETWLNDVLASHYGIAGVEGREMRRVALDDPQRGGVLGLAAVMTATSAPTRAHPSRRGTWVLETLLGREQGEPLADAGELPGDAGEARGRTLRDELDLHRNRAECASCHDVIDPVGLGLQSFDAIGRWRDTEAGQPIGVSGRLPDGEEFIGPAGLKKALLGRSDEILRHLSEQMLAYALGREVENFDRAEVDRIAAEVIEHDGSARKLIEAVVASYPFRHAERPAQDSDERR